MKPYPKEELDRMSKREIIRLYKRTVEQLNDAVPVRHGKWLWADGVRCSQCNYKLATTGLPSYCPNCGARMDEADDE